MCEIKAFLRALPEPVLYLIAGIIVEAILQLAKRWCWKPTDDVYAKMQLLLVAAMVSMWVAFISSASGVGEFMGLWVMGFLSAIGWHEAKDKSLVCMDAAI